MSDKTEFESISLRADIFNRIETRLDHTEFDSVDNYVNYVLREVLHKVESEEVDPKSTDIDESEVEDRLKSLGYLNE